MLIDCGSLKYERVLVPERAVLLIIDSRVERRLEYTDYGRRREELGRALAGQRDAVSKRRLRHVTSENARVLSFARALVGDDLELAGRLLSQSHANLRDDFEVSIPQLDRIVAQAEDSGAYGARMHGDGFGGAVLALVDDARVVAVSKRLSHRSWRVRPAAGASVGQAASAPNPLS